MILGLEFLNPIRKFRLQPITGVLIILAIYLLGILFYKVNKITDNERWIGNHLQNAEVIKVELLSNLQPRSKTFKVTAGIMEVITKDSVIATKGSALFYFPKDSLSAVLRQGDVLALKNTLQPIRNSGNPGSFDFENYMANQNIFYQAFIRNGSWSVAGKNQQTLTDRIINHSLGYAHRVIERFLKGNQEKALAKALLTGDRGSLDRDLVQAYSNTGVVHIMAISGLHLGLIYVFLLRLFGLIPGLKRNNTLKVICVLCGIWFFAFMTGCSPSVMRAATMFSFLSLGLLKRRKVSTYNFWAAAAFILLCFNPLLLFNVGFELSFLAVLGILVVQKPIYNWLHFENKIVDYTWQLISVTLSAQLFTLPLCLYYFHQFPVFFILANIIAIPLASMGLWLGVLLLITGWIPAMASIFGGVVDFIFRIMNDYIRYINRLDFSVWKGFLLTPFDAIVLSLFIVFLLGWLLQKDKSWLKLSLLCLVIMAGASAIRQINVGSQNKMIVYNIPNTTAVDFITANQYSTVLFRRDQEESSNNLPEMITAREFFHSTRSGNVISRIPVGGNELLLNQKKILHIKTGQKFSVPDKRIRLDAIILSGSPEVKIADLAQSFDAEVYIFTPSNKGFQIKKWEKECKELLLRSHNITDAGALVMNY